MLQLIQSNSMEVLVQRLGERLARRGQQAPVLSPQTVLVQSQGMRQWLTIELARRNGVVANLHTPMPAAFLWQVCLRVLGSDLAAPGNPFDKLSMAWHIMALLPSRLDEAEFKPLQDYLQGQQQQQLQRYQLAWRIADVFDQYLVYRPDWILAWEQGETGSLPAEQRWQPILWRALLERVAEAGEQAWHRAAIHGEVQKRLSQGVFATGAIPDSIAVFGLSSLPPQQMALLNALGQVSTVELYAMNPCCHYWGDIVSEKSRSRRLASQALASRSGDDAYLHVGNALLASWGAQGREFFDLLLEHDIVSEDFFTQTTPQNLLAAVQQDILHLRSREQVPLSATARDRFVVVAEDRSLQVHSCHSRMREVEVLHDQLLAMLGSNRALRTRDIVVMVPDITAYTPYINAVFSQRRDGLRALRYSISDRSSAQEAPIVHSFMALLALPLSRFSAPEIVDFLEVPAIARKFGLVEGDIARISHWIEHSGIRWGWDGCSKQQWGLPPEGANTWRFGLDRLLLGYAMPAADGLYADILPSDEVGGGNADLLGRLQVFLDRLWNWRQCLQSDYPWQRWQQLLHQCLDDFFDPDDEESTALDGIRQSVSDLLAQPAVASVAEPITPALLRSVLQQLLQQAGANFGFLSGGINFCTLMPMRSIPFQVVCILGLNDQEFPRRQTPSGFDLVAADQHRRGDRDRRSDDRYQMLEAVLAARECLYLSYIGRDVLDNSEKVASVLLLELLDYCKRNAVLAGDQGSATEAAAQRLLQRLHTRHHLQPFSPEYFKAGSPGLFSYASEYCGADAGHSGIAAAAWHQQSVPAPAASPGHIPLPGLQAFIANPCKAFLQQRLGVYLDISLNELSDTEVLELDGLERYHLRRSAVISQLEGATREQWQGRCRASGSAPLGGPGQSTLASIWSDSMPLSGRLQALLAPPAQQLPVLLDIDGYTLSGDIGPLYAGCLIHWKPGSYQPRQLLQQWLRHVLANRAMGAVTSHMIASESAFTYAPISQEQADAWLRQLLPVFVSGMQRPLPLLPGTAWAWLEALVDKEDPALARRRAEQAWLGSEFSPGESQDAYFGRCFSWPQLMDKEFEALAQSIVEPARSALEQRP